LKQILEKKLVNYSNVEVIYGDFMEVSVAELKAKLGERFVVVANLPYYITTPVIMKLVENGLGQSLTIMVQEEVAARLVAKAGEKEYGAITAQINLVGEVELLRKVPSYMFTPRPNVDSALIKITLMSKYPNDIIKLTKPLIAAAFSCRRKTLANNLIQSLNL
jgi:16S rRNA (adenine1518-N6/adenine1519-N6)-dimethyltransferase